jgi:error-prone DNA polymerase
MKILIGAAGPVMHELRRTAGHHTLFVLRGASSCEELFAQAALLDIPALGITDRNSLAGIVRAHEAAKVTGTRLIVGCRLDLVDLSSILVYPTDRASYGRLCRIAYIVY